MAHSSSGPQLVRPSTGLACANVVGWVCGEGGPRPSPATSSLHDLRPPHPHRPVLDDKSFLGFCARAHHDPHKARGMRKDEGESRRRSRVSNIFGGRNGFSTRFRCTSSLRFYS